MADELEEIMQKCSLTSEELSSADLVKKDVQKVIGACQKCMIGNIMGAKQANFFGVKNFVNQENGNLAIVAVRHKIMDDTLSITMDGVIEGMPSCSTFKPSVGPTVPSQTTSLHTDQLEKPAQNELIVNCTFTGYSKEGVKLGSFEEAFVSRIAKNVSIGDQELERSSSQNKRPVGIASIPTSREPRLFDQADCCVEVASKMHVKSRRSGFGLVGTDLCGRIQKVWAKGMDRTTDPSLIEAEAIRSALINARSVG
ncbi:hypothetical protein ACH5RR_029653 [Cinchona calisaya]|uniref:NBD domain-containing protein n=1 Tax=Cinchona calisaya TaxID=153742 RepID=A0ABD2YSB7_9GENT